MGNKEAAQSIMKFSPTLIPIPGPIVSSGVESSSSKPVKDPKTANEKTENPKEKEGGKESGGGEKKKAEKSSAPPTDEGALNPSNLDLRVGVIKKCWDHPESEKLLCEEIDLGSKHY